MWISTRRAVRFRRDVDTRTAGQLDDGSRITRPVSRVVPARPAERRVRGPRRHNEPLTLMVIDLDFLTALNADHGQDAGDRALAVVAWITT